MQSQGNLNQPGVVEVRKKRSRGEEYPVNRIKGALKDMAIKRCGAGTEMRIPPGDSPLRKTPGEKNLLRIKEEGDIVEEEFLPSDEEGNKEGRDQSDEAQHNSPFSLL